MWRFNVYWLRKIINEGCFLCSTVLCYVQGIKFEDIFRLVVPKSWKENLAHKRKFSLAFIEIKLSVYQRVDSTSSCATAKAIAIISRASYQSRESGGIYGSWSFIHSCPQGPSYCGVRHRISEWAYICLPVVQPHPPDGVGFDASALFEELHSRDRAESADESSVLDLLTFLFHYFSTDPDDTFSPLLHWEKKANNSCAILDNFVLIYAECCINLHCIFPSLYII